MPSIGAVGARSNLRDSLRRLGDLRVACGKGEAESGRAFQPTGDPFADRAQFFSIHAKQCREAIMERSEAQREHADPTAEMRCQVRVIGLIDKMKQDVNDMQKFVDESHGKLYDATRKKKSQSKVDAKSAVFSERAKGLKESKRVLEEIEKLSKSTKEESLASAASGGNAKRKARVRAAMDVLDRANKQRVDTGGTQTAADLHNDPYNDDGVPSLEHATEYQSQYRAIQQQKMEIDRGLDRISATVLRIRHLAIGIGDELENQTRMLAETEKKIQDQTRSIKTVRKQVDKVLKKQAPMNMCVNVFCFIVLLALVGYLLVRFDVVG